MRLTAISSNKKNLHVSHIAGKLLTLNTLKTQNVIHNNGSFMVYFQEYREV